MYIAKNLRISPNMCIEAWSFLGYSTCFQIKGSQFKFQNIFFIFVAFISTKNQNKDKRRHLRIFEIFIYALVYIILIIICSPSMCFQMVWENQASPLTEHLIASARSWVLMDDAALERNQKTPQSGRGTTLRGIEAFWN